jgi:hypothetical protein
MSMNWQYTVLKSKLFTGFECYYKLRAQGLGINVSLGPLPSENKSKISLANDGFNGIIFIGEN